VDCGSSGSTPDTGFAQALAASFNSRLRPESAGGDWRDLFRDTRLKEGIAECEFVEKGAEGEDMRTLVRRLSKTCSAAR
jgi:hypothetical protein